MKKMCEINKRPSFDFLLENELPDYNANFFVLQPSSPFITNRRKSNKLQNQELNILQKKAGFIT